MALVFRLRSRYGGPPIESLQTCGQCDEVRGDTGCQETQDIIELGREEPETCVLLVQVPPHGIHEVRTAEHDRPGQTEQTEEEHRRVDAVHQVLRYGLATGGCDMVGIHTLRVAADNHLHLGRSGLHIATIQVIADGVAMVPEGEDRERDLEYECGGDDPNDLPCKRGYEVTDQHTASGRDRETDPGEQDEHEQV